MFLCENSSAGFDILRFLLSPATSGLKSPPLLFHDISLKHKRISYHHFKNIGITFKI